METNHFFFSVMLYLITKKLSGGITYQELEGCLKLLPPEELEHLDTLERNESSSHSPHVPLVGEITLTNLLECLRHHLKRKQRVIRLARLSYR
ncbi:hypothetical protein HID58_043202 [Brassica napus]|uniref:Uncharacterized protein n=1 Tax=Brassica napus TaxID=3708 RepID=A0ABQ8BFU4_BRANA|nr:hypothetical protein HID58_043202 [Brassica napus]